MSDEQKLKADDGMEKQSSLLSLVATALRYSIPKMLNAENRVTQDSALSTQHFFTAVLSQLHFGAAFRQSALAVLAAAIASVLALLAAAIASVFSLPFLVLASFDAVA